MRITHLFFYMNKMLQIIHCRSIGNLYSILLI